ESELKHNNLQLSDVTREEVLPRVLKKLAFPSLDELYAAIGYGGLSAQKAVNRVREDISAAARTRKKEEPELPVGEKRPGKKSKPVHGVMVEGLDNCLVKFARCCSPVPGDPVIGFITRGFGVSVHRGDCQNYLKSRGNPEDTGRWVNVEWANSPEETYSTGLSVLARARGGLVMDISTALNVMKLKLTAFSARDQDGVTAISVVLGVKNSDDLTAAMARIAAIPDVTEVKRAEG
ncbi:MAG: DUF5913 domain-containing protein, partial [Oscillospiraceae bacterium]|nr:DUF5913 domain-containing protein [Oscillospiraceae bacterium]